MALSGKIVTNKYNNDRYYTLEWSATQSIEKNQSIVSWVLTASGASYEWYAERTLKVMLNGQALINKTDRVVRYGGEIARGTVTITHTNAGNASFNASIEAAVYGSEINCTASDKFELNPIPRKATISSISTFNDAVNPSIIYSNPQGSNVATLQACISFDGATANIAYQNLNKSGTTYTFSLTDADWKNLRTFANDANSKDVYFIIKTVIGNDVFEDKKQVKYNVVNAMPTLNPTVKDVNAATVALTGDENKYLVKYFSTAAYTLGATVKKEATIKAIKAVNGSITQYTDAAAFPAVESGKFTFAIQDSRNNSVSQVVEKTLINYVKITCNLSATAVLGDNGSANANITISGNFFNGSFGKSSNVLSVKYRYKIGYDEYSDYITDNLTVTKSGNTYKATGVIVIPDYQDSCTIQALVTDSLDTTGAASPEKRVIAKPVFDWSNNDFNFNVPIYMDDTQVLDRTVAGNVVISNNGDIYLRPEGVNSGNKQAHLYADDGTFAANNLKANFSIKIGDKDIATNYVLWSGTNLMRDTDTITLSGKVSSQISGIVLVFSRYSGSSANNDNYSYHFIPKIMVSSAGGYGASFMMASNSFAAIGTKYLYFTDTTIKGHANNASSGTASGITYANGSFALRYVLGV